MAESWWLDLVVAYPAPATSLMVPGPEVGDTLAEREALALVLIFREQDAFVTKVSQYFARHSGGKRP